VGWQESMVLQIDGEPCISFTFWPHSRFRSSVLVVYDDTRRLLNLFLFMSMIGWVVVASVLTEVHTNFFFIERVLPLFLAKISGDSI
jgi:hypothetical protein